jgi:hypothetical protein
MRCHEREIQRRNGERKVAAGSLPTGLDMAGRVLFDTNLVNLTLDCGEFIFDGGNIPEQVPQNALEDVCALRAIFFTGKRANWQLAISPLTYDEIDRTPNVARRADLMYLFNELWLYWREFFDVSGLSDEHASSLARRLVDSQYLTIFPQPSDRELVAHAIAYGCDAFCTRDYKTILRHREKVRGLPVRFLSPTEWWREIQPYAALWV